MLILGVIGQTDWPLAHDGSAALIKDRDIVYAIEQERLTRRRYAMGQGAPDAARACLDQLGIRLSDVDHIACGWLPDLQAGNPRCEHIAVSDERTHLLLPPGQFGYTTPPPVHFVQHHYTHAAVTYFTSGFESAAILVMDGRGEGESISLYHAHGNRIEFVESYPMLYSLGVFYSAAGDVAGLGGPGGHAGPGKLMGLAPYGQVRQEIDFSFDANAGRFTLPTQIQARVDAASEPLNAGQMWRFWHDYYREHFYPWDRKAQSLAYDAFHYVDLAASVQHKLEEICLALARRIKCLTGERNLALSGGCALNCSMNAFLSRQNLFDNLYAFPAANDAGCSIGAALALAFFLEPPTTTPPRLVAPALGRKYSESEIAAALSAAGFTPERLPPREVAECVATDLMQNRIVAWFSGRDELGPRALGRRSFLSNPAHRENLGRLNRIKGREMWRPLAPSILDEYAETVLEGSMERGLHRYMLGVATIRPEWRGRVPAVVHTDFTTRPHFVQRAHDGLYWEVIHRFFEKSALPLVCNTSLNVAGQPLVHTPAEALEIYRCTEDVGTLVLEDFYLTRRS